MSYSDLVQYIEPQARSGPNDRIRRAGGRPSGPSGGSRRRGPPPAAAGAIAGRARRGTPISVLSLGIAAFAGISRYGSAAAASLNRGRRMIIRRSAKSLSSHGQNGLSRRPSCSACRPFGTIPSMRRSESGSGTEDRASREEFPSLPLCRCAPIRFLNFLTMCDDTSRSCPRGKAGRHLRRCLPAAPVDAMPRPGQGVADDVRHLPHHAAAGVTSLARSDQR